MVATLVLSAVPTPRGGRAQQEPAEARNAQPRILVVDDEPDIRDALQQILEESLGVAVATAANGLEAQQRLERGERYDVVLTDEKMPGLKGSQLLLWMQDHQPGTHRILMSAFYEGYIGRDLARQAGASHFVRKPLDLRELLPLLRRALTEGGPPTGTGGGGRRGQ